MKSPLALLFLYCGIISACKTIYKPDPKRAAQIQRSITPADSLIKKQSSGIDFIAEGSDPDSWTLEMDFDKDFNFKSSGGTSLKAPSVRPVRLTEVAADSYDTFKEVEKMNVLIYGKACSDAGAFNSSRIVEVTVNNKRYTGCGKYLYDHRINSIWILELIDNSRVSVSDYIKELPRIEFNLPKNKMVGHDGCNNIGSEIEIRGSRIKFSTFNTTKIACTNNQVQKIFSELLSNQLVDYYVKDGKLILYLINDSRLTFRKKE